MSLERLTVSPRRVLVACGSVVALLAVAVLAATRAPAPLAAADATEPAPLASPQPWDPPGPADLEGGQDPDAPQGEDEDGVDGAESPTGEDPLDDADQPVEVARATAHQVAADFAAGYGEHHFDEEPSAAVERIRPFVTDELADELTRNSGAVAAGAERAARQERATATVQAVQEQGGSVEDGYVHLLVVVRQDVTWRGGTETRWPTYLVQVARAGGDWRVARLLP